MLVFTVRWGVRNRGAAVVRPTLVSVISTVFTMALVVRVIIPRHRIISPFGPFILLASTCWDRVLILT